MVEKGRKKQIHAGETFPPAGSYAMIWLSQLGVGTIGAPRTCVLRWWGHWSFPLAPRSSVLHERHHNLHQRVVSHHGFRSGCLWRLSTFCVHIHLPWQQKRNMRWIEMRFFWKSSLQISVSAKECGTLLIFGPNSSFCFPLHSFSFLSLLHCDKCSLCHFFNKRNHGQAFSLD